MTAPAAMPSEEDVARALCKAQHYDPDFDYDPHGVYDRPGSNVRWKLYQVQARAILALFEKHFAPILAEKSLHHVTGERITRKDLNNAYREGSEKGRLAAHLIDGIDSPFNACCYRDHCKALEARALAAEAALAAERERCAQIADNEAARARRSKDVEVREAFTANKIAAAIRAQIALPGAAKDAP